MIQQRPSTTRKLPTVSHPDCARPAAPTLVAPESKQARVLALLRREQGATITELMAATGWLSHSVRGMLSAVLKRKLGLVVESQLETDRGRVYRLPAPRPVKPTRKAKTKGMTAATAA